MRYSTVTTKFMK